MVSMQRGGSFFHHADSFAMIRGGHIDLSVLGAYEVSERGDIANWSTGSDDAIPGVGGAMDLAAGARRLWVLMESANKQGRSRIVKNCSYPLTAVGAVERVYTDIAVLQVGSDGFSIIDTVPGLTEPELIRRLDL